MPVERPALSRDVIVATAVELADLDGLGKLSMRKVADHLGTGAMSLYNHVSDKDELLAGMLEAVLADVPELKFGDDWREPLRQIANWLRARLLAHPWGCDLFITSWPGPHRTLMMETVLGALRRGGFDRRMAHHGFHAIDLFVVGHVHQEASFTIGLEDPAAAMALFLEQAPAETHPYVNEHVAHHADADVDEDDFTFLLELLLDGLAQHR
jgi:AcrR family transcriptional regulator